VLIPEIQLVKLQFHSVSSLSSDFYGLPWRKLHLVLPTHRRKWGRNLRAINRMRLELVLRGTEEKCPHNPNEVSTFNSELVLRNVPGKSR
jgi:hypothetical protein